MHFFYVKTSCFLRVLRTLDRIVRPKKQVVHRLLPRNQLRIRCRCLLWRQDFDLVIVSKKCKLKTRTHMGKLAPTWENSHPHGKTRTHMGKTRTHRGKLAPTIQKTPGLELVEDQMPVSLVATRFHLVGEVQVENSHPHGKRCRNGCVNCKSRGYGRGFGSALVAPVDMPPSTSSVWPLM